VAKTPLGEEIAVTRAKVETAVWAGEGVSACQPLFDVLDDIVRRLAGAEGKAENMAILATGGWGRRDGAPHSDLDLLFLTAAPNDPRAPALADQILYPLWDARESVGHQVRSVDEALALAATDLPTTTALLDARQVAGDEALVRRLRRELHTALSRRGDANAFVEKLLAENRGRRGKFGDSVYLLEPNLKQGHGGLRDLTTALWAARGRWRVRELHELVVLGQASARQVATLTEARDFLCRIRAILHLMTGRRQDQLTFELQEAIAPRLYPMAEVQGTGRAAVAPAVEELMRRYYLCAKGVLRETDRLLERAIVPPHRPPQVRRLDASFTAFNNQVTVADAQIFKTRPGEMLRLFQVAKQHGLPVYGHAKELVAERVATDGGSLPGAADARTAFLELLTDPDDAGQPSILEAMHELGLVNAMMPEFAPTTGRVQHDLYHVYTVDQHQLYAVALLKRLARGEPMKDPPLAQRAAAAYRKVQRPAVLYLATLLHDVGKPLGKGHAEKGARLAVSISRRLGLSEEDVHGVEFLVRHHLLMSHLSQRRDLSDSDMIARFARVIRDEEMLTNLYLLTYVDTAMTAPGNLSDWKARLLGELYDHTRAFLRRGPDLAGGDRSALVDRRRRRAAELAADPAFPAWLAGLPDRYIATHQPQAIARHHQLSKDRGERAAAICVNVYKGVTELSIVAADAPGLLAKVTGVLLANRIDVAGAHIHSRAGEPREAVDVFEVRDRVGRPIPASDPRWAVVESDLDAVVSGRVDIAALIESRRERGGLPPRVTPAVRTEIELDDDVSQDFTVIDVFTQDRLGVLHAITRTLSELGLDIAFSRVATEAERVADVFYVSKITDPAMRLELEKRLQLILAPETRPHATGPQPEPPRSSHP
jgi:[protein-PII] uridylyltransferase